MCWGAEALEGVKIWGVMFRDAAGVITWGVVKFLVEGAGGGVTI